MKPPEDIVQDILKIEIKRIHEVIDNSKPPIAYVRAGTLCQLVHVPDITVVWR